MKLMLVVAGAGALAGFLWFTRIFAPAAAADAFLHPARNISIPAAPEGCSEQRWLSDGLTLRGWKCEAVGARRGTIVYLHGIADNRGSARGVVRFTRAGFEVVTYDSRAHGESDGQICTYGYYEKHDLRRVIESVPSGPIILLGTSLGAAVALQTAAIETRVSAVIAAEVFSDLEMIARERAPWFLSKGMIRRALAIAETRGRFKVSDVSPRTAAMQIHVPVLLIHGTKDQATGSEHSRRVYDALAGTKRLLIVDGAGHNESLRASASWEAIDSIVTAVADGPR